MNKKKNEFFITTLVIMFAVLFIVQCDTPEQQRAALVSDGFIQSSDDIQLYYQVNGDGPDTLVILHGGPGLNFDYLAPDLTQLEEYFTLIYYDQRGAGRSTLETNPDLLTADAHVTDLEAVRQYFGIDKVKLFGHSWGALLATLYAIEYPKMLDGIVMASPAPTRFNPYWQELRPNIMHWMDSMTVADVEQLRSALLDTTISAKSSCNEFWEIYIRGYFSDPYDFDVIRRMQGNFCSGPEDGLRNGYDAGAHTVASITEYDLRDKLNDVTVPVLIITGIDDIFPTEAMYEWEYAILNANLKILESAGHYPQIERPDEFFMTVRDFLQQYSE